MQLTTERGDSWINPSRGEIEAALVSLAPPSNSFVILDKGSGDFLQTTGDQCNGFYIEYKTGERQYCCATDLVAFDDALKMFIGYAEHRSTRKSGYEWKAVEEQRPGLLIAAYVTLGLGAVLAALALIFTEAVGANRNEVGFIGGILFFVGLATEEIIRGRTSGFPTVFRSRNHGGFWFTVGTHVVVAVILFLALLAEIFMAQA